MQAQCVRIGVLSVSLDPVVPEEQRRILLDRPGRADTRIQPASRTPNDLGGAPFRLLSDFKRPFFRGEGASRPVAAVRSLIDAAVADTRLALPAFRICHGQPQGLGRNLGRTTRLHPTLHTSITRASDIP